MTDLLKTPILYSFRRCPYCIRAHMALKYAELKIELRSVELSNLPAEALAVSPHATVPSLVIGEHEYIDESWDIMKWALQQNDPEHWMGENQQFLQEAEMLVETNDFSFKEDLDQYKYADRYPQHPARVYRERGEEFLQELEEMLQQQVFLLAPQITVADVAVFPFIRQFALVDKPWFDAAPYPRLQHWLVAMSGTSWFQDAFRKREIWQSGATDSLL